MPIKNLLKIGKDDLESIYKKYPTINSSDLKRYTFNPGWIFTIKASAKLITEALLNNLILGGTLIYSGRNFFGHYQLVFTGIISFSGNTPTSKSGKIIIGLTFHFSGRFLFDGAIYQRI